MPIPWNVEQILALAPDASAAKAGKSLAAVRHWLILGANEQAAWGECQGSGAKPYQTQIDLSEPAFRCTCPSRKFPCKHGLGLFLLLGAQPAAFTQAAPPGWVQEWLEKRQQKETQKKEKADQKVDKPPVETVPRQQSAAARRAAQREKRVGNGLADLELWLLDLLRQGLAAVQGQPLSFWEGAAGRLVDSQASGLARRVRDMAAIPASGEGWEGRLLEAAARLYLAVESYRRIDDLPQPVQASLRSLIGWTVDQEELLAQPGQRERWLVLGQYVEEELLGSLARAGQANQVLRVQRTWLWGLSSQQAALLLHFAAPGAVLDLSLVPGMELEAEVVYYPAGYPQRALLKERFGAPEKATGMPGYADFTQALEAYATALAADPWLERMPWPLMQITPLLSGERWLALDAMEQSVPLAAGFTRAWSLLALSGGRPLNLFGEWDGQTLWPLGAWVAGRWVNFRRGESST